MKAKRLVIVALALVQLACNGESPSEPITLDNRLVFTRANGSTINFPASAQVFAWCGDWEEDIRVPSVRVFLGTSSAANPGWQLSAVRNDVRTGQALTFPNTFVFSQPRNAHIFLLDPPNELSTAEAQSSGSITFETLSCASGGGISFTIDAVLGSEFSNSPTVRVRGNFRAPIGQAPSF